MSNYIKYERITSVCDDEMLQELFDKLITEGKEIIQYLERPEKFSNGEIAIHVTIITGRRNPATNNILNS